MTRFKVYNTRKGIGVALCVGLAGVVCGSAAWQVGTTRQEILINPAIANVGFSASFGDQKMPPDAARSLLEPHLNQFLKESEAMLESRMNGLKGFFEERKDGAPVFATAVLDISAKWRAATAAGETVLAKAAELFGGVPQTGPDSFIVYVRQCFREKVVDTADVRRVTEQTISGFRGDMADAESRLLVALKVDVPDVANGGEEALPAVETEASALILCDTVVADAVDAATTDLGATLGMFVASTVISNEVVKRTVPEDASTGTQIISNLAVGVATDMATEKAARAMGYDPESSLAAKTKAGLDRMCATIIDGDPAMANVYPTLSMFRRMHPDARVRDACRRADEAVTRVANLGLRMRLLRLRNDRYRGLWKALMAKLAGGEASESPLLMYEPLDAAQCSPADEIIRWAEQVVVAYGTQK